MSITLLLLTLQSFVLLEVAGYGIQSTNSLCSQTFADANGTGIFSFDPTSIGVTQPPQAGDAPHNVSYALTLYQNATSDQYALWFSSGGLNYSDNVALGYDVCQVQLSSPSDLASWRGQVDNGSCLSTLDQDCVNALNALAEDTATTIVQNPTPGPMSNLTNGVLPKVCTDIGNAIEQNFPHECQRPFGGTPQTLSYAMTDYNNASEAVGCCSNFETYGSACTLNGTNVADDPFYALIADYDDTSEAVTNFSNYNTLAWSVFPIMTVFLPIANYQRQGSLTQAYSTISCLHIDHFNQGSHVSPPMPSPTATGAAKKFNGGDIAGIVIGALAGIALIVGLAFYVWHRQKANKRRHGQLEDTSEVPKEVDPAPAYPRMAELSPTGERLELPASEKPAEMHELGDKKLAELSDQQAPVELSDKGPVELSATEPVELDGREAPVELSPDGEVKLKGSR